MPTPTKDLVYFGCRCQRLAVRYGQILEGSFEHALNESVEHRLDLSIFERRHRNGDTGRPAYDPKVLLKVVLYGYYHGVTRAVEEIADRMPTTGVMNERLIDGSPVFHPFAVTN